MTERPILFSAPMVRAILGGSKTQTRRVIKKPGALDALAVFGPAILFKPACADLLPYAVGDRLWVREAFIAGFNLNDATGLPQGEQKVWYRADSHWPQWYDADSESTLDNPPWKSPIHMPRSASRITLKVTAVKVERLKEIRRGDAMEEGCPTLNVEKGPDPRDWFRNVWASLHGPGAWESNPWVTAITFEMVI